MIKNKKQYEVRKVFAEKYRLLLEQIDSSPIPENVHPTIHKAGRDGIQYKLDQVNIEIKEYETQKSKLIK